MPKGFLGGHAWRLNFIGGVWPKTQNLYSLSFFNLFYFLSVLISPLFFIFIHFPGNCLVRCLCDFLFSCVELCALQYCGYLNIFALLSSRERYFVV